MSFLAFGSNLPSGLGPYDIPVTILALILLFIAVKIYEEDSRGAVEGSYIFIFLFIVSILSYCTAAQGMINGFTGDKRIISFLGILHIGYITLVVKLFLLGGAKVKYTVETLKRLTNAVLKGESSESDLKEWQTAMKSLDEFTRLRENDNELRTKIIGAYDAYMAKHHPDKRKVKVRR